MKVLQINVVYGAGSTGKIAQALHDACEEHGIQCLSAHRANNGGKLEDAIAISSKWDSRIHGWWSRFTMFKGTGSVIKTAQFLRKVRGYEPDLIHLHNLHGSYINLPLLFRYIKKYRIPVIWTLHDCWAFTGICSHFALTGCERWKTGCGRCPQKNRFSSAPVDLTGPVWKRKRAWAQGLPQAVMVTPSRWLENLVKESFLKDYPVQTIYNGIDLQVFRETTSDFRSAHGLEGKKIVLGVSFGWSYEKGLDVFVDLADRLPDDIQIVLVGTNASVEAQLPANILSIPRTNDQQELAAVYTAADVFVNPTREEVLGLVNLEALACGTPVVTFRTGGSPECVDETCGVVVDQEDADRLEAEILRICRETPYTKEICRRRAEGFDKELAMKAYIRLYEKIAGK